MRKQISQAVSFSCIVVGLSLCTLPAASQKIETVKGARVVHNEKGGVWRDQPKVKLKLVQTIGGIDVEDPNLVFSQIYDAVLDSTGNIYILDFGNNRIQKLDSQGKYLKTIGRPGQGPGDFQSAFSLDVGKQDFLYVAEALNQRIQILEADGRVLRIIKLETPGIFLIRQLPDNLIVKGGVRRPREWSGKIPPLVEIIDLNGRVKTIFGEVFDYKDASINYIANRFDFDTDDGGNILVSFVYQNRIEKYSCDGRIIWRADRPLNYGTDVDKGRIEKNVSLYSQLNMVSAGIAVDGKGRVWVNTFHRQMTPEEQSLSISGRKRTKEGKISKMDIHKLEIFDSDGILLGEIPLDHLAHGIRVFGDTLLIWERENEIVYQYKIDEVL